MTKKTLKTGLVAAIAVTALAGPFRRLGHAFSPETQYFVPGFFKKDQLEVLDNEPKLKTRMDEVDPNEVTVHGLQVNDKSEAPTEPTEPEAPAAPTEKAKPNASKNTGKDGKK